MLVSLAGVPAPQLVLTRSDSVTELQPGMPTPPSIGEHEDKTILISALDIASEEGKEGHGIEGKASPRGAAEDWAASQLAARTLGINASPAAPTPANPPEGDAEAVAAAAIAIADAAAPAAEAAPVARPLNGRFRISSDEAYMGLIAVFIIGVFMYFAIDTN